MTAPRPDLEFAARYYPSGLVVEDVVAGFRSHRVVRVRFDSWDDAAMVLATNPWERHWLYDFGDGDGDAERRAFLVQRIAGSGRWAPDAENVFADEAATVLRLRESAVAVCERLEGIVRPRNADLFRGPRASPREHPRQALRARRGGRLRAAAAAGVRLPPRIAVLASVGRRLSVAAPRAVAAARRPRRADDSRGAAPARLR